MRSYISSVFIEFTMEFLFKKSPPVDVVRGFVANCYSIVYCTNGLFIILSLLFMYLHWGDGQGVKNIFFITFCLCYNKPETKLQIEGWSFK